MVFQFALVEYLELLAIVFVLVQSWKLLWKDGTV